MSGYKTQKHDHMKALKAVFEKDSETHEEFVASLVINPNKYV